MNLLETLKVQAWKDKYISSFVSLAAPWAGSMQIVRLFASGYNMNYYRVILPPSKLRAMQRSFTSSAFLFPSPVAWKPTDILASTAEKNYTTENIKEFFHDIDYMVGWEQYKQAARLNGNLSAPGVPVHCVYGTGVPTPERFEWAPGYVEAVGFPSLFPISDTSPTTHPRSSWEMAMEL